MASYFEERSSPAIDLEMPEWIVEMEVLEQEQRSADAQRTTQTAGNGRPLYRVPEHVREGQDVSSPCVPRKISIGPYHHQKGEWEKKKCVVNFLIRFGEPLKEYRNSLAKIVNELGAMYDNLDECWLGEGNNEAFLQMMVVDGCYLLEIMIEALEAQLVYGEPQLDAVFNSNEMETYRHDMLLLDNQIPIKVLACILEMSEDVVFADQDLILGLIRQYNFQLAGNGRISSFLGSLIHHFFSLPGPAVEEERKSSPHLLSVYRWVLLGGETYTKSPIERDSIMSWNSYYDMVPSATQLEDAQIAIRPSAREHQINISFDIRTGLVLQQIVVDATTSSVLYNVILYERLDWSGTKHFSSYIYFMHCLLKDTADSRLLRAHGILRTTLSDKQVIEVFNQLCKTISFHHEKAMDYKIWDIGVNLRDHFGKNMQTWRKDLFQKYLRSPWAVFSIFVAFLIFTFTAFQTGYTILGYYHIGN